MRWWRGHLPRPGVQPQEATELTLQMVEEFQREGASHLGQLGEGNLGYPCLFGSFEEIEGDVAMKSKKLEIVKGSGNVFRDLGHRNADADHSPPCSRNTSSKADGLLQRIWSGEV